MTAIEWEQLEALVIAPALEGRGGLGRSAGDFAHGLRQLGASTTYLGTPPASALTRLSRRRLLRRIDSSYHRRSEWRDVRRAAAAGSDWHFAYAVAGTAPIERPAGSVVALHQPTHFPSIEFERLQRAARRTGGRTDFTAAELRQRLRELQQVDVVRVTSETVRQQFLEAGFAADRLVHAYPSIDLQRYVPGDKSGALRIAYIGGFSMRKGIDIAADLSHRFHGDDAVLTVGGVTDRWSRQQFERGRFVPQADVPAMLADCQFMILPSRSDAFANVVLEALAAGCIPIVSPEVGASELLRELDPRLVVELTDFVDDVPGLLQELPRDELARRGRRLAATFDRDRRLRATVTDVVGAALAHRSTGVDVV